ncbi:CPBP family intramembrane glutamic endopeptidase [Thalassobellus suaedae]|uniref:Type II CAAX endopeptidase family protein n=1 Tax=Thalassobellus suaedae TaxID=3074124 RepID=A0ABY9XY31_9FLAO|nr:type II CAAX endopeptidase family protein [Flavobacteriaceae bacterium HL-DH14]
MKQLATYFGLAYLISWIIWLPLYGHIFGLSDLPTLPFHHGLGGLGPLIASFLTTWIYNKQEGAKLLLKKCLQVRPIIYLTIALLSPFLLALIASIINHFIDKAPINLSGLLSYKEFPKFSFITFFIYNLIFFGFGEEVGWRGFALPRFQDKFNALTSSLILTVFWAIWHLPLFFYRPGYTSMEFAGIFGWLFSLLTGSVLLTWLFNSSKGSILICAVFHSTIDIAFTADLADKNIVNYMGFLITVWGILTIIIFKPKNLSTRERKKNIST